MPGVDLPVPTYMKNDKDTIQNLFDTVMRLRKELDFLMQNLDEQNVIRAKSVIAEWIYAGNVEAEQITAGTLTLSDSMKITNDAGTVEITATSFTMGNATGTIEITPTGIEIDSDTIYIAINDTGFTMKTKDNAVQISNQGITLENGDILIYDQSGNSTILDSYGLDTKFIKWFKNMCYNSSFEVFDPTTLVPFHWTGSHSTVISTATSSFFDTYSLELPVGKSAIQSGDGVVNPQFYNNVSVKTRISFHKKGGKVKIEVLDGDNSDAAWTLTDEAGATGAYKEYAYNSNWVPQSYTVQLTHGSSTKLKVKFTNTDSSYSAYIDGVIIEPDYTGKRPSFYTDGPKSSISTTAPIGVIATTTGSGGSGTGGTVWAGGSNAVNQNWYSVCYANSQYLAVGSFGTNNRVITSPDAITWTNQTSAANYSWCGVCYGNGIYVAVAYSGGTTDKVMTSPDGIVWTKQTAAANRGWCSVCYGNGLLVAVASSGTGNRVMTSNDGVNWTIQTEAENNSWQSVTYGNGLFVAVSNDGTHRVMTSTDGVTWAAQTAANAYGWQSVTYGNGLFVAVAYSGGTTKSVMTSPNGVTWTEQTTPYFNNSWTSVTYGNGLFVAVSYGGDSGKRAMTSPDGVSWTIQTSIGTTTSAWQSVCYGDELFVAVAFSGNAGEIVMSSVSDPTPPIVTVTPDIATAAQGALADTALQEIADKSITLAKMADMATASLIYRKTTGAGVPEVNTLATLKADLGLSATDSIVFVNITATTLIQGATGKFGNVAGGNYAEFESDGTLKFVGDATIWDDLRVEPSLKNTGVTTNNPAYEKWFDDGAGSKGVFLYSFTDEHVNEKELHFTVQFPHAWKGTAIYPHIHWIPKTTENATKVKWGFEYTWTDIGSTFGNTTLVTKDTTTSEDANKTASKHYITAFDAITPSASQDGLSSILIGRIFRNSTDNTNDTYTDKCGLLYIDIHYEIDTLGSRSEYSK